MNSCVLRPAPDPHRFLSSCASACCSRAPALKFQDPAALKELCQARSVTSDPAPRRQLSLDIYRLRALEHQQWKAALLDSAAKGDWGARRLRQRRVTHSLGSRTAAATHVKEHFDQRFQDVSEAPVCFEGVDDLDDLEPEI
jgi:hypothetical protein